MQIGIGITKRDYFLRYVEIFSGISNVLDKHSLYFLYILFYFVHYILLLLLFLLSIFIFLLAALMSSRGLGPPNYAFFF